MINRNPPARFGLVVCLLGVWCAGCSGTPFGEQLAERLSEPGNPVEETTVVNGLPRGAAADMPTGEQPTEQPPGSGGPLEDVEERSPSNPTASTTASGDVSKSRLAPPPPPNGLRETSSTKPPATPSSPPRNPTPYRLLLRLPAADPAAPAEAVTQALRGAGILFEVETIERLPPQPPSPPAP